MKRIGVENEMLSFYRRELAYSLMLRELLVLMLIMDIYSVKSQRQLSVVLASLQFSFYKFIKLYP